MQWGIDNPRKGETQQEKREFVSWSTELVDAISDEYITLTSKLLLPDGYG